VPKAGDGGHWQESRQQVLGQAMQCLWSLRFLPLKRLRGNLIEWGVSCRNLSSGKGVGLRTSTGLWRARRGLRQEWNLGMVTHTCNPSYLGG
jgi:hypothetical protein